MTAAVLSRKPAVCSSRVRRTVPSAVAGSHPPATPSSSSLLRPASGDTAARLGNAAAPPAV